MDYTKDALELTAMEWRSALLDRLGPMAPGNSQFTPDNLRDSLGDRGIYVLRPAAARAFVAQHKARIWKAEVCDCDTRTRGLGSDLSDLATELGWDRGAGLADQWYTSKTLGLPHTNRLSGYHSAPNMLVQDEAGRDIDLWVIQPKTLYLPSGNIIQEVWAKPEQEVRQWVFATSLA